MRALVLDLLLNTYDAHRPKPKRGDQANWIGKGLKTLGGGGRHAVDDP